MTFFHKRKQQQHVLNKKGIETKQKEKKFNWFNDLRVPLILLSELAAKEEGDKQTGNLIRFHGENKEMGIRSFSLLIHPNTKPHQ